MANFAEGNPASDPQTVNLLRMLFRGAVPPGVGGQPAQPAAAPPATPWAPVAGSPGTEPAPVTGDSRAAVPGAPFPTPAERRAADEAARKNGGPGGVARYVEGAGSPQQDARTGESRPTGAGASPDAPRTGSGAIARVAGSQPAPLVSSGAQPAPGAARGGAGVFAAPGDAGGGASSPFAAAPTLQSRADFWASPEGKAAAATIPPRPEAPHKPGKLAKVLAVLGAAMEEFGHPGAGAGQVARWNEERHRQEKEQRDYDANLPTVREQIYQRNVLQPEQEKWALAREVAQTNEAIARARAAGEPRPSAQATLDQQLDAAVAKGDKAEIDRLLEIRERKEGTKEKPQPITNPFEAYARGTPEEKAAATQFLDAEEKRKQKAAKPSEWEERYRLFKQDPDAYLQMTGATQHAATADRQHAERMLKFFDAQRGSVAKDFLLDEPTRKERLDEIAELEKPYLELARPANAAAGGGGEKLAAAAHGRPGASAKPLGGGKPRVTTLDRNNPEHQQIAAEILEEAGGDKEKAREIARKRGYKF